MIRLRTYQREAVDAVYAHLRGRDDNPCIVIPTAGGKTPVTALICKDAVGRSGGRVLVLATELDVGVYSAGLKSRDTAHQVIVAGIQSVYRRASELSRFDIVLVDEPHMIPPDGEGMYRTFLKAARRLNPHVRLIGLTATPYRMKTGMICAPKHLLNHVCYEIGVRELIVGGYLGRLRTKAGREKADTSGLHVRMGEFIAGETQDLMGTDRLVRSACEEIVEYTHDRRSCLIFASGVEHGKHIARVLREEHGVECGCVFGETLSKARRGTLCLPRRTSSLPGQLRRADDGLRRPQHRHRRHAPSDALARAPVPVLRARLPNLPGQGGLSDPRFRRERPPAWPRRCHPRPPRLERQRRGAGEGVPPLPLGDRLRIPRLRRLRIRLPRARAQEARAGGLCETLSITVRHVSGEKYGRIVGYRLGPKPANGCDREGYVLTEEVPF